MPAFKISDQIFSTFPDVLIGFVLFHGINNDGENEEITRSLREAEELTVERFTGQSIPEHPNIASWREAYRKFGAKPKDYPSSVENLVRRVAKGYQLPHINLLVDLYNAASLRHIVPVGGEDLDAIRGDVVLTFANENEAPVKLLGETEERPPKVGEVIYKDDVGAICRRWNWKEADRTKFTKATKNGFLVIEALPPFGSELLETVTTELANIVRTYCGGEVKTGTLSASTSDSLSF